MNLRNWEVSFDHKDDGNQGLRKLVIRTTSQPSRESAAVEIVHQIPDLLLIDQQPGAEDRMTRLLTHHGFTIREIKEVTREE